MLQYAKLLMGLQKVQLDNDHEKAHSEIPTPKTEVGKLNRQLGT